MENGNVPQQQYVLFLPKPGYALAKMISLI